MKLSCLPVSFFKEIIEGRMSVGQWAAMGKSLGLDAIDLSILFVPDRRTPVVADLRAKIESQGIGVTMITSYPDFTHPDAAQRARELDLARQTVEVCAGLGARYLRVTAGQAHPSTDRAEGIAWASERLRILAESSRGSGVTLVYENHAKPGAWQYTDFSQPPDIFFQIVQNTADTGLQVNFDTGNATAFADDPCELLGKVISRVETIHASDTTARGALNHVLLGSGATPFLPLFRQLRQSGWDGWICMEEASKMGRDGVKKAAAFVRATWGKT